MIYVLISPLFNTLLAIQITQSYMRVRASLGIRAIRRKRSRAATVASCRERCGYPTSSPISFIDLRVRLELHLCVYRMDVIKIC